MYVHIQVIEDQVLREKLLNYKEALGMVYHAIDQEHDWLDRVNAVQVDIETRRIVLPLRAVASITKLTERQANWLNTHELITSWWYSYDREGKNRVDGQKLPVSQDEPQARFVTAQTTNFTFELDRQEGVFRLSWSGGQIFLVRETTAQMMRFLVDNKAALESGQKEEEDHAKES